MTDYGASDTSTTSLGANQFPINEAWVPNNALTAIEGIAVNTDAGGKKSTPIRMGMKDGDQVTLGAQADAAATTDTGTFSYIALFKRLLQGITTGNTNTSNTATNTSTVAGAITSNVVQSNTKQVNGTTVSVNQGTIDAGTQRIAQGGAATGTKSNVASSASSVTILASNTSRKGAIVYNDSTQILYLDLSGGTASNSSYSVQIPANGFFELPGPMIYNGAITGIWAAANGNARVTEFS